LLTAATNNRAVCLLFKRDLSGAVAALETPLMSSHPESFIEEVLVFNLNTLTDLHSEKPQASLLFGRGILALNFHLSHSKAFNQDKKIQIGRVISQHADDAFDTAVVSSN
jgi:hypothetical protein